MRGRESRLAALGGLLLALLFLLRPGLAAAQVPAAPPRTQAYVPPIAPGQGALFRDLLGGRGPLADGCRLARVEEFADHVVGRYACARGETSVELREPNPRPPPGAVATHRFVVVPDGGALAPGLLGDVVRRVRSGERAFQWGPPPPPPRPWAQRARAFEEVRLIVPPTVAFLVALVALALVARRLVAGAPRDAAAFAGVTLAALALRLAMPWGPVDFCEGARLEPLWSPFPDFEVGYSASVVVLGALHLAGASMVTLVRWAGPSLGALGVGTTFLCGRAAGLPRPAALLAAGVLLAWPPHVHYSASSVMMLAPAVWPAAFAVALSPRLPPAARVALAASLAVLGYEARPECTVLLLPMAVLTRSPGWTWPMRLACAALLAPALGVYLGPERHLNPVSNYHLWLKFADTVWTAPTVAQPWWILAGLVGFLFGAVTRPARVALALATAMLGVSYVKFGGETNPLWGEWRYTTALLPYLALGAAALAADLVPARAGALPYAALAALATALPLGANWSFLHRPVDSQVEFAYVLESAPRVAYDHDQLALVTARDLTAEDRVRPERNGIPFQAIAHFALAVTLDVALSPIGCEGQLPSGDLLHVRDADALLPGCREELDLRRTALYLGMFDLPSLRARLAGRYRLEAIEERVVRAAQTMPFISTQCPVEANAIPMKELRDCAMRFGWYRLVPVDR